MFRIFKALLGKSEAEECVQIGFDDQTTSFLMLIRQFSMKKSFEMNVGNFVIYSNVIFAQNSVFFFKHILI